MVRPVDVQQIVLQTNPIEKIQQTQQRHPDMQQRYLETQLKVQKNQEKDRLHQTEKADRIRITQDEERKGNRQDQGRSPTEKKTPPGEIADKSEHQGHHVDTTA